MNRSQAPFSLERWYVLGMTCVIYAINIADRYVVSTVLEPIRLELHLTTRTALSSGSCRAS